MALPGRRESLLRALGPWRELTAAAGALDLVTSCHSPVFRMATSMRLGPAWSPTQAYRGAGSHAARERTNREVPLMDSGERASAEHVRLAGTARGGNALTRRRTGTALRNAPAAMPSAAGGPLVTRIPVFPDVWECEPAEAGRGRGDLACLHGTGRCLRRDCRRGDAGRRWRNGLVGDAVGTADAAPPGVDDSGRDGHGCPAGWAAGDQPPDYAGPRAVAAGCGGQAAG